MSVDMSQTTEESVDPMVDDKINELRHLMEVIEPSPKDACAKDNQKPVNHESIVTIFKMWGHNVDIGKVKAFFPTPSDKPPTRGYVESMLRQHKNVLENSCAVIFDIRLCEVFDPDKTEMISPEDLKIAMKAARFPFNEKKFQKNIKLDGMMKDGKVYYKGYIAAFGAKGDKAKDAEKEG